MPNLLYYEKKNHITEGNGNVKMNAECRGTNDLTKPEYQNPNAEYDPAFLRCSGNPPLAKEHPGCHTNGITLEIPTCPTRKLPPNIGTVGLEVGDQGDRVRGRGFTGNVHGERRPAA